MKVSGNAACPCGSGAKLKKCCALFHGGRPAAPEQLMRARYCAYALGKVAFVMDTTHPESRLQRERVAWKAELVDYCRGTEFLGLQIHEHGVDEEAGEAFVEFTADLRKDGRDVGFRERSTFRRDGKRWKYFDGELR